MDTEVSGGPWDLYSHLASSEVQFDVCRTTQRDYSYTGTGSRVKILVVRSRSGFGGLRNYTPTPSTVPGSKR